MSQQRLHIFYEPNYRLAQAYDLLGYNAGYAERLGEATFDQYQKNLVWRLLGDVDIGPNSNVLDVGCGIGGPSSWIFERYQPARLVGLEYCPSSVRAANQRWAGKPVRPYFVEGDAHRIPLPDASIDVIFNLESALHYADKDTFISECKRVLRPGGTLCLGDICTRYRRFFGFLGILNLIPNQFSTHARLWSPERYKEAFKSAGMTLKRHEVVTRQSALSLKDGLDEVIRRGMETTRGFRGRYYYLCMIEKLLRRGWLTYELFNVGKP